MVIFQVLKAASMKMTSFWDIAPCSPVVDQRTRDIALLIEVVSISETSAYFHEALNSRMLSPSIYKLQLRKSSFLPCASSAF
jgi:hypothetical protein